MIRPSRENRLRDYFAMLCAKRMEDGCDLRAGGVGLRGQLHCRCPG